MNKDFFHHPMHREKNIPKASRDDLPFPGLAAAALGENGENGEKIQYFIDT